MCFHAALASIGEMGSKFALKKIRVAGAREGWGLGVPAKNAMLPESH